MPPCANPVSFKPRLAFRHLVITMNLWRPEIFLATRLVFEINQQYIFIVGDHHVCGLDVGVYELILVEHAVEDVCQLLRSFRKKVQPKYFEFFSKANGIFPKDSERMVLVVTCNDMLGVRSQDKVSWRREDLWMAVGTMP